MLTGVIFGKRRGEIWRGLSGRWPIVGYRYRLRPSVVFKHLRGRLCRSVMNRTIAPLLRHMALRSIFGATRKERGLGSCHGRTGRFGINPFRWRCDGTIG